MAEIKDIIKNPYRIFTYLAKKFEFRFISDKTYLKWMYRATIEKNINLDNPKTFTEKLQWIKLYDRKPVYTTMVDKYEAKKWASKLIGDEHIIKTIGVWDNPNDIDFDKLPNKFVLKCTHDSHSVLICTDKGNFDFDNARKKLAKAMKKNYYYEGRQWPYKNVLPKIIAEEYMIDNEIGELRDYKFFCFNGEPKIMYIATGRGSGETYGDFFDMDFQHMDLKIDHDIAPTAPVKPLLFEEMKGAAKILSAGVPQVRVDFYEVNGKFYFGEMTFFHCSGFAKFHPDEWDLILGSWIDLP